MIAALILLISVAAGIQLFVAYCRSIIGAYSKVEISEQTREVARLGGGVGSDDFPRLLQLVDLCPEPGDDATEIRAVRTYYGMLGGVRAVLRAIVPAVGQWIERERSQCAYFAAVALDRRIAFNRDLMAQQASTL